MICDQLRQHRVEVVNRSDRTQGFVYFEHPRVAMAQEAPVNRFVDLRRILSVSFGSVGQAQAQGYSKEIPPERA